MARIHRAPINRSAGRTFSGGRRPRAVLAGALALGLLAAACGSDDDDSSDTTAAPTSAAATTAAPATTADAGAATTTAGGGETPSVPADLVAAAKEEGTVNLIALPDDWANYKGILASFTANYGVKTTVASPDASSADEITAVETLQGQPDMPCALDVSPAKAQEAVEKGLFEPFEPSTLGEVPAELKDPDGNWVAAYYGVMAIGTNTTLVANAPTTFADLEDPQYKGQVAINGDPRQAGAAFAAVFAASLANGGSFDDIMPGIEYFAGLKASGNLIDLQVSTDTVLSGDTPIVLDWTYNFPGLLPKVVDAGFEMTFVVPADGVYGSYYAQGVVKDCPQPNAAKLWIEHILSNDGALGYLEGGAVPARYAELEKAGLVTEDISKNLPAGDILAQIEFATPDQIAAANAMLTEHWGPMVADA